MTDAAPEGTDELLAASRGLLGVVARSLAPALEDVTVPQFRLIVLVVTLGPTRSGDLAERLAVGPSTLTRNVDRLVSGGWVERRPSEESRREVLIAATERGHVLVDEVTARRRQELAAVLGRGYPPSSARGRRGDGGAAACDERAAARGDLGVRRLTTPVRVGCMSYNHCVHASNSGGPCPRASHPIGTCTSRAPGSAVPPCDSPCPRWSSAPERGSPPSRSAG